MNLVTSLEELQRTVDEYMCADAFCFDIETLGEDRLDPHSNRVAWIAMATSGRVDVIPMGHPNGNELLRIDRPLLGSGILRQAKGLPLRDSDYSKDKSKEVPIFDAPPDQLFPAQVFAALRPLMSSSVLKVGHNIKFDAKSIAKYLGFFPSRPYADTMIAAFICDNRNSKALSLKDCLHRELEIDMQKGIGAMIEHYSFNDVAQYAYLDAKYTWLLWRFFENRLKESSLLGIYQLEMDVLDVISRMELRGVDIDQGSLEALRDSLTQELEAVAAKIYRIAGKVFNLNSNRSKQDLLFSPKKQGGRGLRGGVLTNAGEKRRASGKDGSVEDYSVSAPALERYRGKDALVDALLQYADLNKLLSTYITPYLGGDVERTVLGKSKIVKKRALVVDGKVHTEFIQHGAETGRFSSRNPNLQNVPSAHTEYGRSIRNLFVAPPNHVLIVADYSQIEPRVIASLSQDEVMIQNYVDGSDIYTTVGDTMGVDRRTGKTLVLAVSYDVGPIKIAETLGCSIDEAKELITTFYDRFPTIRKYKTKVVKTARNQHPTPYVTTVMGRRRYLPDLSSSDFSLRLRAERQAFNTKIQGTAADIMKLAMVRADALIPDVADLVLTVHDELVACAPASLADETASAIYEAMEKVEVKQLRVPLVADLKVVTRWGDAK